MILLKLLAIAEIFIGTVNSDISTGDDNLGKILNGRDAKDGEFPYQVQILKRGVVICGGSIVDKYHIITAAHCVSPFGAFPENDIRPYTVVAGLLYKYDDYNPHRLELSVWKIYLHDNYHKNSSGLHNDIAIVRLKRGFKNFTEFIQPVNLNTYEPKEGMCNMTGWGFTTSRRMYQPLEVRLKSALQAMEVPLINSDECKKLGTVVENGTLCVNYNAEGPVPCSGDDGGPIVCNEKLTGIIPYTPRCAGPGNRLYTDVFFFKDWIAKTLKESKEEIDIYCSRIRTMQ